MKALILYSFPADLQILLHLSQRLHFVLSMASIQQTVTAHIHPFICTVVAQYLFVCLAPSLGDVPQWIHQQMVAKRRSLQMRLEVFSTKRHFTLQTGFDSQRWLPFLSLRGAAITWYFTMLLLTLRAGKATFAIALVAPGLTDACRAEAVTTGQGVGLAEAVSTHRAGQLFLQGRHSEAP